MIKVAKDLLSIFMKNSDYFYDGEAVTIDSFDKLKQLSTMLQLFRLRERKYLGRLINKMTSFKDQGFSNYEILMMKVSD